jgi:hypothetical protein
MGPSCVMGVQRVDATLLFAHLSIALKIDQSGLEVRKLQPPKVGWGHLTKTFSIEQVIIYFRTPQKILKCYFVAFRVT